MLCPGRRVWPKVSLKFVDGEGLLGRTGGEEGQQLPGVDGRLHRHVDGLAIAHERHCSEQGEVQLCGRRDDDAGGEGVGRVGRALVGTFSEVLERHPDGRSVERDDRVGGVHLAAGGERHGQFGSPTGGEGRAKQRHGEFVGIEIERLARPGSYQSFRGGETDLMAPSERFCQSGGAGVPPFSRLR